MNIGEQIQSIRKKNGLSQDGFAELFNISRQTVSNWENGKSYPDLEMIIKISDYFNISIDDLLKPDRKIVSKIDSQKKKTRIYFEMLIAVTIASILIVTCLYFNYKNSNTFAFTMNKEETYTRHETSDTEIQVANGFFSLPKSTKLKLDINAVIDDGKIHIYILNQDDKLCYQLDGQEIEDSQNLFFDKGSYMIQIVADGYDEDVVSLNYDINVHN